MISWFNRTSLVGVTNVILGLSLFGCSGAPTSGQESDEPVASHPPAALSLSLDEGRTVEFFDIAGEVLVTESGPAHGKPALSNPEAIRLQREGALIDLFHLLQPKATEVPAPLLELQNTVTQARNIEPALKNSELQASLEDQLSGSPITSSVRSTVDGVGIQQSADLIGCGNGCCDPDWTRSDLCQWIWNSYNAYTWYNFNYGYSTFSGSSSTKGYEGTVCAAIGTSRYTVAIRDAGGSWDVVEQYYFTYQWWTHNSGKTTTAAVNSSGNQHMHMFCGGKNN